MPVSSSEADRAHPLVPGARALLAALLSLVALLALTPTPAGAAAKAPALLKKTKIVAPTANNYVRGTLTGSKCYVKFPAKNRKVTVTVTGPLSDKKPKSKKLAVKRVKPKGAKNSVNARKANCTWKTASFKDGTYRFTAKGQVRARGKWWGISLKRAVVVRNATSVASGATGPKLGIGNARYVGRIETPWDTWLGQADTDPTRQAWMRDHMWQVVAHAPSFDPRTKWAPPALLYKDLYAIYRNDAATLAAHPDWVLKNQAGQQMVIPWGCEAGVCPQFAGDIGNPAFRAEWIRQAQATLPQGYIGLWIDDANMEMRVANPDGKEAQPIDPRTGQLMTYANYRRYVAEFLEEIRRAIPNTQLVANVLWFGGTSIGRDVDQFIIRAYSAVDRLNLERGFNDEGLTGGSAPRDIWAVDTFMQFIDRMHDRGKPITFDSAGYGVESWEYNLAGFFLVDRGEDAVGELRLQPGQWWNGWDISIGGPVGERSRGSDGVFRRSFQKGLVLLNPPKTATKTVTLPQPMKRIDGSVVTKVTLAPGRGAVLQN